MEAIALLLSNNCGFKEHPKEAKASEDAGVPKHAHHPKSSPTHIYTCPPLFLSVLVLLEKSMIEPQVQESGPVIHQLLVEGGSKSGSDRDVRKYS